LISNEKARSDSKNICAFARDAERIQLNPGKAATNMPGRLAMKCLQAALRRQTVL
jgi:hypothetical protein